MKVETITRRWACAAAASMLVTFFGVGGARAATINVTTTNMGPSPSGCGFVEALQALNNQTATGGCTGGNGTSDIINLPAGTYTATGTLSVLRNVEIRGAGVGQTIVRANLSSGTELFLVAPPVTAAAVVFQDLTIDKASGQTATQVTGVYADAMVLGDYLYVSFLRTRIAGHTWSGIYSDGAGIEIHDSTIDSNTSPESGGGVAVHNNGNSIGSTNIYNSTISNNTSQQSGGGIYHNAQGNSHLGSSTVSGNRAMADGGGIYLNSVTDYFQMDQDTIAFNRAVAGGGIRSAGNGNYYTFTTIVAQNTADDVFPDWEGYVVSLSDSLIGNTFGLEIRGDDGNNLLDAWANLDPTLSDLGGPYHTKVHRALAGSPVIDHHTFCDPPPATFTDQRYFARGVDGDGVSGPLCDIGAFEYDPSWQTESLLVAAKSSDTHVVVTTSGYTNGQGTNLQSNAANDFVTYAVPVTDTGTYNVKVRVRKGPTSGKFQLGVSSSPTGTFTAIGSVQDLYASSSTFVELNIASNASLTIGTRYFRFLVNTKNNASNGSQLFLDTIKLTKL